MLKIAKLFEHKEQNVSLIASVLEVTDIHHVSQGKSKLYALADDTGSVTATIYDQKKKEVFVEGIGVVIMNALVKDSYLAITSRTDIAVCKSVEASEEIKVKAPSLKDTIPNANVAAMTIAKALRSPIKTLAPIKAKVVQIISHNEVLDDLSDVENGDEPADCAATRYNIGCI